MPKPPNTRGISVRRTYTRHPGREIRARLERAALPMLLLPGRLRNSRNFAAQRESPETQAANSKLAQISSRPPADLAAVMSASGKFRPLLFFVACLLKLLLNLRVLNSFGCSHA